MSTVDYLIQVAEATDKNIWVGLCYYVYLALRKFESEKNSSDLSIGVANLVLRHKPANSEVEEFASHNGDRIRQEARNLIQDKALCELLSAAAYNNAYGIYVASGGSRLFNRFLQFIREDRKEAGTDLLPIVAEPIYNLRRLGLWIRREHNPNELDYLKAVQSFAQQQDQLVKQLQSSTAKEQPQQDLSFEDEEGFQRHWRAGRSKNERLSALGEMQPVTDDHQRECNRQENLERVGNVPTPEQKMPENPLQKVGWPTQEQVVSSFEAWKNGGEAGLLEWVKNNQRKED